MAKSTTNSIIASAIYRADKAGVDHGMSLEELAPLIAEQEGLPISEITHEAIKEEIRHLYWLEQYV